MCIAADLEEASYDDSNETLNRRRDDVFVLQMRGCVAKQTVTRATDVLLFFARPTRVKPEQHKDDESLFTQSYL